MNTLVTKIAMNAPHVSVIIICSVSMLDKLEKLDLFGLSKNIMIRGIAFARRSITIRVKS